MVHHRCVGGPPHSPPLAVQPRKFLKVNSWGGSADFLELTLPLFAFFEENSQHTLPLLRFFGFFSGAVQPRWKILAKMVKNSGSAAKILKSGGKNFGGKNETRHLCCWAAKKMCLDDFGYFALAGDRSIPEIFCILPNTP